MRIAIICTYYPFPPSVGGVETIVQQVAVELARRGHEVHVISSNLDVTTQKPVTSIGVEEREGVRVHKLESRAIGIGYARVLKGLYEVVSRIKPDIIHIHSLHPMLFQLAKWKERLGYKLIAELHHPAACAEKLSTRLALPLTMLIFAMQYAKAIDVFIAHTELERQWLTGWKIPQEKVITIRFPALPREIFNYAEEVHQHRENTILFLGRVVKRKGVEVLLRAYAKIIDNVDAKLVIAGPISPNYFRRITKMITKLKLVSNNVDIRGAVSERDKLSLIVSSKLLVLPSYREYTPVTLLEAQALKTPVVASRVGAIPEIVIDGETGLLVEPGNVEGLAKAIELLLSDENLWRRMSTRAREFAKNFTLEKSISELEKLYCLVLEGLL